MSELESFNRKPQRLLTEKERMERNLKTAFGLFEMAMEVKRTQLRALHPHLSERELNHMAYAMIEKGCSR
jgi:hypothetical protein